MPAWEAAEPTITKANGTTTQPNRNLMGLHCHLNNMVDLAWVS